MLKRWNLGLIVGTFLLSIFGTFITRSGVIASVHSFTQSNVGYFFLGVPGGRRRAVVHAALHPLAAARGRGAARVDAEPRGGVPVQQPAAGGHRVLGAVGDALPDPLRGGAGHQDHGRPAVLQPGERPARAAAAGAHRHRPAHRLAEGVGGQPAAAVHRPGGGGRRDPGGAARGGRARLVRRDGARARRLRGRDDRAGVLPRRPRPAADARRIGAAGASSG